MCRLLAYLGEPIGLGRLVAQPAHSLLRQSWLARELVEATVNADGWGAGIFLPGDPRPCVYTSTSPIWADPNLSHLGRALGSHSMVAAVRSATDSLSVAHANTQPFSTEGLLFVHNGFVQPFRTALKKKVYEHLSDETFSGISGVTDSEHLFALILEGAGGSLEPEALLSAGTNAIRLLSTWAVRAGGKGHFSLVLATSDALVAFRSSTGPTPPSLYLLPEPGPLTDGIVIASEPLDEDPRWQSIEPETAVVARKGHPPERVRLAP